MKRLIITAIVLLTSNLMAAETATDCQAINPERVETKKATIPSSVRPTAGKARKQ